MLKKSNLILLLSSLAFTVSCGKQNTSSDSSEASTASSVTESEESTVSSSTTFQEVTVDFYVDYNTYTANVRDTYDTQIIKNGDKLTKPATPDAPFKDFPNFLGWSTFALIEDPDLLWDFDNDIVNIEDTELIIFGIWGA